MERLRSFVRSNIPVYEASNGCSYPLDKNENLLIPRELIEGIIARAASKTDPRLYPQGEETELAEMLAEILSVERDMVNITNGADEAIDLLLTLAGVLVKEPRVLTLKPSFPMYALRSLVRGYRVDYIPLREGDFGFDIDVAVDKASKSDLVFLCSPNNPTGNLVDKRLIRAVAESTKGLVVVDQAYIEFSDDKQEDLINSYENLAVVRTFSKAYGLAGLRLGYIVAGSDVSRAIRVIKLPFQINKFSLLVGIEALRAREEILRYVEEVKRLRKVLVSRLRGIDYLEPYDTQTNFVFVRPSLDMDLIDKTLRSRGMCVRLYRGLFREGDQYIRISVPREEVIDLLIKALEDMGS
ncbi:MAG: histidinol-phosphate transaminase [Sulfolobales archaeon]